MMKKTFAVAATIAAIGATTAYAQDLPREVKARQGQFQIMAINLGILGGIAKGEIEYDAATAQAAAD
jgi:cytochrome c556